MEKGEKSVKLSIIVPIYNVEEYLPRCFDCLEKQKKDEIEIILVDDGSPDNSGVLCDEFAKDKEYVKVIHKTNGGLSDARNTGLRMAVGTYCMFLDSDDTIVSDACDFIIKKTSGNDLDILYMDINWISKNKESKYGKRGFSVEQIITGEMALASELEKGKFAAMSQIGIYNTNLLRNNNLFFKQGILHEDEQWSPRVMLEAYRVMRTEFSYYNYYIRENSITQNKKVKRYYDMIDTIYELSSLYKKSENNQLRKYGSQYLAKLYMNAVSNLICAGESVDIDKELIARKLIGIREISKGLLFFFSPRLYLKMMEK